VQRNHVFDLVRIDVEARHQDHVLLAVDDADEAFVIHDADVSGAEESVGRHHLGGLVRLVRTAYDLLGLVTFFTAGETESRAWTIREGTKAAQAAGKIHSDMERGFIRAEAYHYNDLIACGSEAGVKEKGLFRLEGRDYLVKDGDVLFFRFNV